MMAHSAALIVGMQVDLDWNAMKWMGKESYEYGLNVEAIGYDWVIFRKDRKVYAATFDNYQESGSFLQGVKILVKGEDREDD